MVARKGKELLPGNLSQDQAAPGSILNQRTKRGWWFLRIRVESKGRGDGGRERLLGHAWGGPK